jgi:glycosyltransferase involved in cell wall biosynthesis
VSNYSGVSASSSLLPEVTIALPVYNGASLVIAALTAIMDQNYQNLKIIISDDNSTDNTFEICSKFSEGKGNMTVIQNSLNLGGDGNLLRILKGCKSKYFVWACQDDTWSPNFVSELVACLESDPNLVLAQGRVKLVNESGTFREISFLKRWNPNHLTKYGVLNCLLLPIYRLQPVKYNLFLHGVLRTSAFKSAFANKYWVGGHDRGYMMLMALSGRWGYVDNVDYYRRVDVGNDLRKTRAGSRLKWISFQAIAPLLNFFKMIIGIMTIEGNDPKIKIYTFLCILVYLIYSYLSLIKASAVSILRICVSETNFERIKNYYRNIVKY